MEKYLKLSGLLIAKLSLLAAQMIEELLFMITVKLGISRQEKRK
jgi:hypothetical protein